MHYTKPALSIAKQIQLLQSRGVGINNIEFASQCLQYIGYYRLSGYIKHFAIKENFYKVSFEEIISLYQFDKELRLLVMDAVGDNRNCS